MRGQGTSSFVGATVAKPEFAELVQKRKIDGEEKIGGRHGVDGDERTVLEMQPWAGGWVIKNGAGKYCMVPGIKCFAEEAVWRVGQGERV